MESSTKENLTDRSKWVRFLYMVFFAIAYAVAELLFWLVTLFQAVVVLVSGRANEAALTFGHNLSVYIYQIVQFETFNDEYLPFPFNEWPDETADADNPWLGESGEGVAPAANEAPAADQAPAADNNASAAEEPAPDADPEDHKPGN